MFIVYSFFCPPPPPPLSLSLSLSLRHKVEDPEKYNFSPKRLLDLLTDIYLHLSDGDGLARAIVTDDRSYRKELFDQCIRILYNRGIKNKVRFTHTLSLSFSLSLVLWAMCVCSCNFFLFHCMRVQTCILQLFPDHSFVSMKIYTMCLSPSLSLSLHVQLYLLPINCYIISMISMNLIMYMYGVYDRFFTPPSFLAYMYT